MSWLSVGDAVGVVVFALSGTLLAMRKSMDLLGLWVVASLTALGGGTLRDVLLDVHPLGWMHNPLYLELVTLAVAVAILWERRQPAWPEKLFLWADAFGLAVFSVMGAKKSLMVFPGGWMLAILMGTLTAVGGGILRDLVCSEVPHVFRRDIYATASALGAGLFTLLTALHCATWISTIAGVVVVVMVRIVAVAKDWSLPVFKLYRDH